MLDSNLRYTQKESPPKKSFPLSHVIVDVSFLRVYFPDIQFAPISTKASLGFVTTECGTHVNSLINFAHRYLLSLTHPNSVEAHHLLATSELLNIPKFCIILLVRVGLLANY